MIFSRNVFSHNTENFEGETFCVSKKSGTEMLCFWEKRGGGKGGSITIFCQKKLPDIAKKLRRGTLLCCRKFLITKNFKDKRRGECDVFPSKLFFLTVPNLVLEGPFYVSETFAYRIFLCIRGEYQDFLQKTICLTVPKKFVGEAFCANLQKNYVSEKVIDRRGEVNIKNFRRKFFDSQYRITS